MPDFQLVSPFPPAGDQPRAIDELVDGLGGGLELGLGEQRVHRLEVPLGCLLERGHGQPGQRVLEAQHGALAVVLLVA